ncbi:MAG: hypothetical protein H7Y88_08820 [Phycisphaerales bacterium]|nr:hypothetical protein [Phycisphaerales bacterium]
MALRMNKVVLAMWLAMPIVVIGVLWVWAVDRERGKPSAAAMHTQLMRIDASSHDATTPKATGQPPAEAAGVQPESLAQGFIVVVEDKSKKSTGASPIVMASSHNGWNPADGKMQLSQRSDMRWQIVWEKPALDSRIAFKFARGSWEAVETKADYSDIENRMLPLVDVSKLKEGEKPVIELTVEGWKDFSPSASEPAALRLNEYREVKVSAGSIVRVDVTGGGASNGAMVRDCLIWLPPGYDDAANAERRYPVLYLQDGQNLFEQMPGVPGEWKVDETAAALMAAGTIEPLIVVGIPHAGKGRIAEYVPIEVYEGHAPGGDAYADFVVREVLPRVERAVRAKAGAENRGIGGSSLGAVAALHTAMRHPGVFGKVLLESPAMLSKEKALVKFFEGPGPDAWPAEVWIGMGGKETGTGEDAAKLNEQYVALAKELGELATKRGATLHAVVIGADAVHNEGAWAERLPKALEALFPSR